MPGSNRQRDLARRRAERQAARRREAAARKRKQRLIVGGSGLGVLVLLLAIFFVVNANDDDDDTPDAADAAASATPEPSESAAPAKQVACGGARPADVAPQTFESLPPTSIDVARKYTATFKTSCGEVVVDLLDNEAPETVNSLNFLAGKKYFDGTPCHRMLTGADSVLQCGDPTGTGTGGPGYNIKDENLPKGDGEMYTYPAGTLAMAKSSQPNSGGSQFFFVIKDSPFPPDYAVFGKVTKGMDVLEKILAVGTEPGSDVPAPAQDVFLESVTVAAS